MPLIMDQLRLVDTAMHEQPFLVSGQLTLADLFLAPMLFYFIKTPEGKQCIPQFPDLKRWLHSLSLRKTFQTVCSADHI